MNMTIHEPALLPRAKQSVLHNMSCPPRKSISRKGSDMCFRVSFDLWQLTGKPPASHQSPDMEDRDIPVEDWPETPVIAELLGLGSVNGLSILKRCRELAAAAPAMHSLPTIAPVLENVQGRSVAGLTDDLSLALGVLGRCSETVFIRRKPPVFDVNTLIRRITLILPEDWSYEQ